MREVLVNAIAHRDYSMTDMPIRLAIFSDRLEIESPGALPHGMTVEQLGHPLPEWQELGPVIRTMFAPHPETLVPAGTDDRTNVPVDVPDRVRLAPSEWLQLNQRQRWVLSRPAAGEELARADIERTWSVTQKTAKRDLKGLHDRHVIEYVGPPKTGKWRLIGG